MSEYILSTQLRKLLQLSNTVLSAQAQEFAQEHKDVEISELVLSGIEHAPRRFAKWEHLQEFFRVMQTYAAVEKDFFTEREDLEKCASAEENAKFLASLEKIAEGLVDKVEEEELVIPWEEEVRRHKQKEIERLALLMALEFCRHFTDEYKKQKEKADE